MENKIDIDISALFESQKDEIKRAALEGLKEKIQDNIRWQFADAIGKQVEQFVKEQLAPEIPAILEANKGEMLNQLKGLVINLGNEIAKSLHTKAVENLTKSWNVDKLGKALFE